MAGTFTVKMLGESQKEQWTNAIGVYALVIRANAEDIRFNSDDERIVGACGSILRVLDDFEKEMKRLVEGVFDD